MKVPYVLTDKTATLYVAGNPVTVDRDTETFQKLTIELGRDEHDLDAIKLILKGYEDEVFAVQEESNEGRVEVSRRGVYYDGILVNSALARRILDIAQAGLPVDPWIRFMEKVYQNPEEFAREELYLWIEESDLPITEDGDFLAYKRVRDDYKDIHSGTFDNTPGTVVELPGGRAVVDPNRFNTCSVGLHFCSKSYLPHFGAGTGNVVLLLKINPADVVSIPSDYSNAKGRTFRYEVLQEIEYETAEWAPIVSNDGNPFRFDPEGYDAEGYNANGYDRDGYDEDGFNADGYDFDGYDEDGYNANGYDEDGYDVNGFDVSGFDADGYDYDGYDEDGLDRDGWDGDDYDLDEADELEEVAEAAVSPVEAASTPWWLR